MSITAFKALIKKNWCDEPMTKILFVDDNATICTMYGNMLEKSGYSVVSANSGPEALKLLDTKSFDLILLDIMMEPMDGWEVLEHIRERDDCAGISVVVLTAKALLPGEALEYGDAILGFCMKPLFVETLQDFLTLILSEKDEREKFLFACGDDESARNSVTEYMALRQQIRVWEEMFSLIVKTFGEVVDDEFSECPMQIKSIRDVIAGKKARLTELEDSVKAYTT